MKALPLRFLTGVDAVRFRSTHALLSVWVRPWSATAMRYAAHALATAFRNGHDVLEERSSGVRRTAYTRAEALTAYWERPHSERAYSAALEALAVAGALAGSEAEAL